MDHIPLWMLVVALGILIALSAFFSSSETSMMSLDRYRLRHLSRQGSRGARRAGNMLAQPDRLIGLILIGNNLVNILATTIATVITIRLFGENMVVTMSLLLTVIILIFAEVTPKTIAALYPEKIAFPASWVLRPLMTALWPVVLAVNRVSNCLVRLLGFNPHRAPEMALGADELRTIVDDAHRIPERHQDMLLNVLDLEKASVNDIMIPRKDVYGIDLEDDDNAIIRKIRDSRFTRIVVYREDIDNIEGILHLRHASLFIQNERLDRHRMQQLLREPYFVPEQTPLHTQLYNFQKEKRRMGIVVDEYGSLLGAVTLEDILEDIVGEFTTQLVGLTADIRPQPDGSYHINGSVNLRDINRALGWQLPTAESKTLNGLLVEVLEGFPDGPACVAIGPHRLEILSIRGTMIQRVRATRPHRRSPPGETPAQR